MKDNSVFPITKSYLSLNLKVVAALGIWNPFEKGLQCWFYRVYSAYVVVVIIMMRILSIFLRTVEAPNGTVFIQEFSLLALKVADAIKYLAFALHRQKVLEISDIFNWERHISGTKEITQYRNQTLTNALNASKTFTITISVALIQFYLFYYYFALCYSGHKVESLPIGSVPLKYCFVLTNFWIAFISDYLSFTWLGLVAVCHDAFIMALMIHITAQLKILNFRLENCHRTVNSNDDDDDDDDDGGGGGGGESEGIIHFACFKKEGNGKILYLDPNEELINCIKYHQQIVQMLNIFKDMYNTVLLPQLLTSLLCIVISGLQLIADEPKNLTETIQVAVFLIAVILELLAFCWGGNFILVESDKTSNAFYASEWYNRDKIFRSNVKIFLGAVRSPMVVSAGGFVNLSAETFKNILTKGYSGAAVLKNSGN